MPVGNIGFSLRSGIRILVFGAFLKGFMKKSVKIHQRRVSKMTVFDENFVFLLFNDLSLPWNVLEPGTLVLTQRYDNNRMCKKIGKIFY